MRMLHCIVHVFHIRVTVCNLYVQFYIDVSICVCVNMCVCVIIVVCVFGCWSYWGHLKAILRIAEPSRVHLEDLIVILGLS
jgi:hypothetical protein